MLRTILLSVMLLITLNTMIVAKNMNRQKKGETMLAKIFGEKPTFKIENASDKIENKLSI